jgi:hypothetical protein
LDQDLDGSKDHPRISSSTGFYMYPEIKVSKLKKKNLRKKMVENQFINHFACEKNRMESPVCVVTES